MRWLALIAVALLGSGCAKKVVVHSDTCWTGNVNGGSISGCGGQTYTLNGDNKCWVFQKETDYGFLRADDAHGHHSAETSEPYGVVSGCSE